MSAQDIGNAIRIIPTGSLVSVDLRREFPANCLERRREVFFDNVDWIKFLIRKVIAPECRALNGIVRYFGQDKLFMDMLYTGSVTPVTFAHSTRHNSYVEENDEFEQL